MATFCPHCDKEIGDAIHHTWWVKDFLKRFEMKCPGCEQMLEIDVESEPVFLLHKKSDKKNPLSEKWGGAA